MHEREDEVMIGQRGAYHGSDLEHVPASERRRRARLEEPLAQHSDERLMAAYVTGDERAFSELFRRYAPRLSALLRRSGAADAADLVQQTFMRLHRARTTYQLGAPVRPWLMTIARNIQRGHLRSVSRRPVAEELSSEHIACARAGADVMLEASRAVDALASLPEGEREVLVLHGAFGLTIRETATRLGASEACVKARAHRAYQRLRASV